MMMNPTVPAKVAKTHLLPLLRSLILRSRGENLLAMLPVVSAVRASTMLRPVKTSANALSNDDRAWSIVIANVSGSGAGPYRSARNAPASPPSPPSTAASAWSSSSAVSMSSTTPLILGIVRPPGRQRAGTPMLEIDARNR